MAYQLIINVSSPTIFSSLKKILGAMEGVTIEQKKQGTKKSTTDAILADKDLMESIERGKDDIAQGRSMKISASDINSILGI